MSTDQVSPESSINLQRGLSSRAYEELWKFTLQKAAKPWYGPASDDGDRKMVAVSLPTPQAVSPHDTLNDRVLDNLFIKGPHYLIVFANGEMAVVETSDHPETDAEFNPQNSDNVYLNEPNPFILWTGLLNRAQKNEITIVARGDLDKDQEVIQNHIRVAIETARDHISKNNQEQTPISEQARSHNIDALEKWLS